MSIETMLENTEERKRLLDEANFSKIVTLQQEINEATEVSPSYRKLINLIIEQADILTIKKSLIEKLKV